MKHSTHRRKTALAAVAIAVLAAIVGIVVGQGNAALAWGSDRLSLPPKAEKFKRPMLKHGELTVKGTNADEIGRASCRERV